MRVKSFYISPRALANQVGILDRPEESKLWLLGAMSAFSARWPRAITRRTATSTYAWTRIPAQGLLAL